MKVIDLLNKIANGEEVPSEINCYNQAFYLSDGIYIAKNQVGKYFEDYFDFSSLNYEVEIMEGTPKEDKKIEKIKNYKIKRTMGLDCKIQEEKIPKNYSLEENEIVDKINEIIDKINGE